MSKELNYMEDLEKGQALAVEAVKCGPVVAKSIASTLIEVIADYSGMSFEEVLDDIKVAHAAIVDKHGELHIYA